MVDARPQQGRAGAEVVRAGAFGQTGLGVDGPVGEAAHPRAGEHRDRGVGEQLTGFHRTFPGILYTAVE